MIYVVFIAKGGGIDQKQRVTNGEALAFTCCCQTDMRSCLEESELSDELYSL